MRVLTSSAIIPRSSDWSASLSKTRQPIIAPSSVCAIRIRLPYFMRCSVTSLVVSMPCDARKCKRATVSGLSPNCTRLMLASFTASGAGAGTGAGEGSGSSHADEESLRINILRQLSSSYSSSEAGDAGEVGDPGVQTWSPSHSRTSNDKPSAMVLFWWVVGETTSIDILIQGLILFGFTAFKYID